MIFLKGVLANSTLSDFSCSFSTYTLLFSGLLTTESDTFIKVLESTLSMDYFWFQGTASFGFPNKIGLPPAFFLFHVAIIRVCSYCSVFEPAYCCLACRTPTIYCTHCSFPPAGQPVCSCLPALWPKPSSYRPGCR